MPTSRATGHRLRSGTYSSSGITSGYAIESWAVQSDQQDSAGLTIVEWTAPYQMIPLQYARIVTNADGTARKDGFLKGIFGPFSYWTFGMLSYFRTTYLNGGVKSALASAMFYDETDAAQYINLTVFDPIPGEDMEAAVGGWKNVRIRCDFGTITS